MPVRFTPHHPHLLITDAPQVPGAEVGVAQQFIDLEAGALVSEVGLEVKPLPGLPGAKGVVITSCALSELPSPPSGVNSAAGSRPNVLELTVESTRVADSNVAGPLFNAVSVPVQRVFETLRGSGATKVKAEVTYLDSDIRITRTLPSREVFVYRRL